MANTQKQVLKLYKTMLRESSKFTSYNFRNYALRKIKDTFRVNRNLKDVELISNKIEEATSSLQVIKRQALIGNLYESEKLVIEKSSNKNA